MADPTEDLAQLGEEEFVSLTTFRRSGVPVSVPVWIAPGPDGDRELVITTTVRSGKVKRIRRDRRAQLTPCDRTGDPRPGARTVTVRAELVEDPDEVRRLREAIRDKYGERMKVTAADTGATPDATSEPRRVIVRITA